MELEYSVGHTRPLQSKETVKYQSNGHMLHVQDQKVAWNITFMSYTNGSRPRWRDTVLVPQSQVQSPTKVSLATKRMSLSAFYVSLLKTWLNWQRQRFMCTMKHPCDLTLLSPLVLGISVYCINLRRSICGTPVLPCTCWNRNRQCVGS